MTRWCATAEKSRIGRHRRTAAVSGDLREPTKYVDSKLA